MPVAMLSMAFAARDATIGSCMSCSWRRAIVRARSIDRRDRLARIVKAISCKPPKNIKPPYNHHSIAELASRLPMVGWARGSLVSDGGTLITGGGCGVGG